MTIYKKVGGKDNFKIDQKSIRNNNLQKSCWDQKFVQCTIFTLGISSKILLLIIVVSILLIIIWDAKAKKLIYVN